jgi:hypothetical protein
MRVPFQAKSILTGTNVTVISVTDLSTHRIYWVRDLFGNVWFVPALMFTRA